ncbi:hypothetical protein ACFU7Y_38735 [Kitasatospora sp. NPDC057542]|nr:hypothetical protein [Streptomyces sp. LS1784]
MTQILALQGLETETGTSAYTSTILPPSHTSSALHMRFDAPVSDETAR